MYAIIVRSSHSKSSLKYEYIEYKIKSCDMDMFIFYKLYKCVFNDVDVQNRTLNEKSPQLLIDVTSSLK
jgi:hypothetical protein